MTGVSPPETDSRWGMGGTCCILCCKERGGGVPGKLLHAGQLTPCAKATARHTAIDPHLGSCPCQHHTYSLSANAHPLVQPTVASDRLHTVCQTTHIAQHQKTPACDIGDINIAIPDVSREGA